MRTLKIKLLLSLLCLCSLTYTYGQQQNQELELYAKSKVPNALPGPDKEVRENNRVMGVSKPTLTIYLPPKERANGTAVVICPGGGYARLAIGHEGHDVARKLNEQGIAAFVLKYRLPDAAITSSPELAPLQDAQQALKIVRQRAKEWNINPTRIGIMGFSAGGHLASTAGTQFDRTTVDNPEKTSLRPDFLLLVYPVISGEDGLAHKGSFENLLGKDALPERIKAYSGEQQVTAQTPPTFLVHASDDKSVPSMNSVVFYQALLQHNVPAELHIYQNGGHGFGLNNKTTDDAWFDRCMNWLKSNKFVNK